MFRRRVVPDTGANLSAEILRRRATPLPVVTGAAYSGVFDVGPTLHSAPTLTAAR